MGLHIMRPTSVFALKFSLHTLIQVVCAFFLKSEYSIAHKIVDQMISDFKNMFM